MDIYAYIEKDHQTIRGLIDRTIDTQNPEKQTELLFEIKKQLELHQEAEEQNFYDALTLLGPASLQEMLGHSEEEHQEISQFLELLTTTATGSDSWYLLFGQLKHAVDYHMRVEESVVFEKARKLLSPQQAAALAMEMEKFKRQQAPGQVHKKTLDDLNFIQRLFA